LAQQSLANRKSDRAYLLAIKGARATGGFQELCALLSSARVHFTYDSLILRGMSCGTVASAQTTGIRRCEQNR
jgi:hypothetical protein